METLIDIALKVGLIIFVVFVAAVIMHKNNSNKK
ncbi:hypothetical protein SAMN06297280_1711 [Arsukibacterium tuosuense]|uniref:Uncharacterized protein n=1 Tax=Arsukibacterium tuosuense TaxID=1323745 RepID=A0A285ISE2_9GAMM|nr:hypothetical protein SAMN06297280_1711 [Arsukibacterium tuosuense]